MRIPKFILRRLQRWASAYMQNRPFDKLIRHVDGSPHFYRWYIWGAPKAPTDQHYSHNADVPFYLYLHVFVTDDEPDPHDHPRHNISLVLGAIDKFSLIGKISNGLGYCEWIKGRLWWRPAGTLIFRHAATPHRVILPKEAPGVVSLFFGWRKVREWGFICPGGRWVHWEIYHERDSENRQRGCQ